MFEFDQEIIQNLLRDSIDFKRMHDKHGKLELEIEQAYNQTDRVDDLLLGTMKKEKLQLKDQMAEMVDNYRHAHSN
jgi:uncharacterized protein YdcH (DUF465 family)